VFMSVSVSVSVSVLVSVRSVHGARFRSTGHLSMYKYL